MSEAPVLVGTAGWSYKDWEDVVYPAGERDKVKYMARYFDCVEINTSFYRPVNPAYAERWVGSVSDKEHFRFAAKLWQRFTHETEKPYGKQDLGVFKDGVKPLVDASRLVALLVQFPFYFRDSSESRDLLQRISEDFAEYPKVLEVRDISWSRPEAVEFITDQNYNIACLDMPLTRSSFNEYSLVTGDMAYLRLHGRNADAWFSKKAGRDDKYNYLYSDDEIEDTWERIDKMRQTANQAVVIWNNHFRGKAAVNAFQTLHKLLGGKVSVPETLRRAYPHLDRIAKPDDGMLF